MGSEEDPDEELFADWRRGDAYAKALLMPSERQPSTLPFKQKKVTTSSETATNSIRMKSVEGESALKACAGRISAPVVYDLSDSEGTPVARPLVRRFTERTAAVAKPASASWKQYSNAEVVTLDSDSDGEVSPSCTAKSFVKVEKLSQPSTRGCWTGKVISPDVEGKVDSELSGGKVDSELSGAVNERRDSVSQEALLEKVIRFDDDDIKAGLQLPGFLEQSRQAVSQGGLLGRAITVDDESLAIKDGKKFPGKVVQFAETSPAGGGLLEKSIPLELDGMVGSISSGTHVLAADTAALGQSCDHPPRWDDGFAVAVASTSLTFPASAARRNIASSLDDIPRTAGVSRKRSNVSIEGVIHSDPEQGPSRKCMRPEDDGLVREEEKKRSSPVQPNFQDLTGSDDEIWPNSKSELPGKLEIARASAPLEGIVGKGPSIDMQGIVGSISNEADVDIALQAATAYVAERSTWWNDGSPQADPSATLNSVVVKPKRAREGNVDERDYLQTNCGYGELPNSPAEGSGSLGPAQAKVRSYFRKANVCASEENRGSPPVQPKFQDLTSRKCMRPEDDGLVREEEKKRSSPVQPNFQDLTGSDDEIWPNSKSELPGKLEIARESAPLGGIVRKGPSIEMQGIVGSISNEADMDIALQAATAYVAERSTWWNDGSPQADPSATLNSVVVKPKRAREGNVDERDYLQTSCGYGELPNSAAEGSESLGPAQAKVRSYVRKANVCVSEENRGSPPVQPKFQDLTSDDEGCASEPEWLQRAYESVSLRGSLDSPVGHDVSGPGFPDQHLPASGGNGKPSDHVAGKKRRSLDILGHESQENRGFAVHTSAIDLESDDSGLVVEDKSKRKRGRPIGAAAERRVLHDAGNVPSNRIRSRARKDPSSEEEVSARAQKQRERELTKARQDEEKRAKEEKKEELKRQKDAAKEVAKQQKEALAERRRLEKENNKWMTGKFALPNTIVHLDTTVMEMKDVGSLILQQFTSKEYNYKVNPNPIKRTIVWTMKRPSTDSQTDTEGLGSQTGDVIDVQISNSQFALEEVEIKYVAIVLQGEEFVDLVSKNTLHAHVSSVRKLYPTYSVCYLINGLMKFLHRKEQHQFKTGDKSWTRPNVEQALAELITHHTGMQARLCIDGSEIADHLVGLTRSLAECPFKKKLTSTSVHANGDHVTKHDPNKDVIRKSVWLKFLVAIPRVNGAIAMAIAKQYPTMRALLNAYLDPLRTDLEKELLLEGLVKDYALGVTSSNGKRVGSHVSRRIYRVMMARDGSLSIEDAADGADHFTCEED